ncbi:Elongation factor Ts [Candidatus Clavichlamydia salmonicola]|uniref:translation elongation factor Ts n=1 Tax=Candidatus Clavichlamydia salmonicola TaxID=469812 RepID=UPI00189186EC|nr:translation elongation factor Ts [Candidatus Clavichlamydia salmonicola]MBF5050713.1 Elongation factor Ts [Candidatus Clavichlamydia salmonicola]
MSAISTDLIKALRQQTGVGLTKCKEALEVSKGNLEDALTYLRKKGLASAAKKEGRETKEGVIKVSASSSGLSLVEVDVETDFVAANDRFQSFAADLADDFLSQGAQTDLNQFLQKPFSKDLSLTIDEHKSVMMQTLGENVVIKRVLFIPKKPGHSLGFYSHSGGKVVAVVELAGSGNFEDLAKEVALHVAAASPLYLSPESVPAEVLAREKDIAADQVKNKPDHVVQKIIDGKLAAFFEEMCLLNQSFVKDSSKTIASLIAESGASLISFVRWKVGE